MKIFYGIAFVLAGLLGWLPDTEQARSDAAVLIAYAAVSKTAPAPAPAPAPKPTPKPDEPDGAKVDPKPAPAPVLACECQDGCKCGADCKCVGCKLDGSCCECGKGKPFTQWNVGPLKFGTFDHKTFYRYDWVAIERSVTTHEQKCFGTYCKLVPVTVKKIDHEWQWVQVK